MYSATKQESKTFYNHIFGLKTTQINLLDIKMTITIIFIVFYKIANFPYIANTEATHVQASFHRFFTDFG